MEPKISTLHENSYVFLLSPSFGCEALMNPRAPRWWRKHLIYSISSSSLVYVFRWSDLWCTSLDRRLNVKHIWIFSEFSTVRLAYIIFMPTIHSPLYTFLLDHLLFFSPWVPKPLLHSPSLFIPFLGGWLRFNEREDAIYDLQTYMMWAAQRSLPRKESTRMWREIKIPMSCIDGRHLLNSSFGLWGRQGTL